MHRERHAAKMLGARALERAGKLDPVIGREGLVRQILEVLL